MCHKKVELVFFVVFFFVFFSSLWMCESLLEYTSFPMVNLPKQMINIHQSIHISVSSVTPSSLYPGSHLTEIVYIVQHNEDCPLV